MLDSVEISRNIVYFIIQQILNKMYINAVAYQVIYTTSSYTCSARSVVGLRCNDIMTLYQHHVTAEQ